MQQVSDFCRTAGPVGAEKIRESEEILVTAARQLDLRQTRIVLERFRYCVDPDGVQGDLNDAFFSPLSASEPDLGGHLQAGRGA